MHAGDTRWLAEALDTTGAIAGTVHRLDGDRLRITAAIDIPPPVVEATREIPRGKGMAGLAWLRGAPVAACDLQTDASGDVRPGARAVDAGQAIAVPVFGAGGTLRAVVGFAFAATGEPDAARISALQVCAERLPLR